MIIIEIPAKPKEEKIIRVAAYARVSADKDEAFHSLEAQKAYYENYVSKHSDWILVGIYSDNGISGTIVNRPEFQRMLQDCKDGKIDLVITKSVTRFARNTVVLLETIRELKALGIDCYFEKENMHSISPDGELLLTLLAMYAEEEARSVSENQKWRIRKKFENGEPWVGNMLGYRLIDGSMVIVPEEAEIVRQIFSDYLSGMGLQRISKKLISSGFETPYVKYWSQNGISKILRNEKYVGDMLLQKTYHEDFRTNKKKKNHGEKRQYYVENSHEAIIDRETFDAVQEEIKRRAAICHHTSTSSDQPNERETNVSSPERISSPFTGKLTCGICGQNYIRKKRKYGSQYTPYWICNGSDKKGKSFCPSQKIPESILIDKTKEVLNLSSEEELTNDALTRLSGIIVPGHNHITFTFASGSAREIFWQHKSRSKSWTPEMRQRAREKALAQHRGKEDDNE